MPVPPTAAVARDDRPSPGFGAGAGSDAAGFSGTDRTVAEYLLAEVLDRQPAVTDAAAAA